MPRPFSLMIAMTLTVMTSGCYFYAGGQGAAVVIEKVTVTQVQGGKVVVKGLPGAVLGDAYGVTLTVRREGGYTTQHLTGTGMSIVSGYALVSKDGSFPPTTLGDPVDFVKSGDELNIKAYERTTNDGTGIQLQDAGDDAFLALR